MTIALYLDDVRSPPDDTWTVCRTVAEAKDLLLAGPGDHPEDAAPCTACGHSCHDHYAGGGRCFDTGCGCVDYVNAAWPAGQVSSVADQAAAAAERERQRAEWQAKHDAEQEAMRARARACREDWERRQAEKARQKS